MNKKIIVIVAVVVLITIVSTVVISTHNSSNEQSKIVLENEKYAEAVEFETLSETINNDNFNISMKYPKLMNLPYKYREYFNEKIKSDLDYLTIYDEMTAGMLNADDAGLFTYTTTFERYNCDKYVSIVVSQAISLGESRTISKKKCYVIDAKNERNALLEDVMQNKANFKNEVLKEIEYQASINHVDIKGGNGITSIEDEQTFYIKDYKLHLYFEPAEIAAASDGELDFETTFKFKDGEFVR